MFPVIYIFEGEYSAELMDLFFEYGAYFDSKHRNDVLWLKENTMNGNLYSINEKGICTTLEDPDFLVSFTEELTKEEWEILLTSFVVKKFPDWFEKPLKDKIEMDKIEGQEIYEFGMNGIVTSIKPEYEPLKSPYNFQTFYIKDIDTMLYQIDKPTERLPFTVVVEKYTLYGHKRLFSDIYGSRDWDNNRITGRFDFLFLQNLWNHLELPGEFNMNVVKERVDGCFPSKLHEGIPPDSEPIVYRKNIENVLNTLKRKYGFVGK